MGPAFAVDLRDLHKGLNEVSRRQLPFAMAQALTITAGHVGVSWQGEMKAVLDRPSPFTVNAVAVRPARKALLIATVYVKDVAAEYLEPYVEGGTHFLGGKRGLLTPKAVPLNAYGNLTRNKLATLKAKSNVYVGAVKLRSGAAVSGVWQRPTASARRRTGGRAALKLLIRFSDPLQVRQRLDFYGRAETVIRAQFASAFADAFEHAMATAR